MPRKSLEIHYREVVEQVVDNDIRIVSKKARKEGLRDRLGRGGEAALSAQRELRENLHDYHKKMLRPVQIDVQTVGVILGREQDWIEDHREALGHNGKKGRGVLYDYDKVCEVAHKLPPKVGERCIFIVDGAEVVGTFLKANTFGTLHDKLDAGAVFKTIPLERALLMQWRDKDDHRIWADAYLSVMARMIAQTTNENVRSDGHGAQPNRR